MLSNLNPHLNYPVVGPLILIIMVLLKTQFHAIQSISKFLGISKKKQNFLHCSQHFFLTKSFKKYQIANGYTTSFHCPNFYGGATKCNSMIFTSEHVSKQAGFFVTQLNAPMPTFGHLLGNSLSH